MPHPDAVLPRERARALSFNAFTARPDHWDMSILCARTVTDTYIEQARRGDVVIRSEEFTLTPALVADLDAQARLRASIVGEEEGSEGCESAIVEEPEEEEGVENGGARATSTAKPRRLSEDEAFAQMSAWRYDPANPGVGV